MKERNLGIMCTKYATLAILFLSVVYAAGTAWAQAPSGALRGQVTDPSGAAITGATAVMTPPTGSPIVARTNTQGMYELTALPAGKYILTVVAPGFTTYENDNVVITDQPLRLNVPLSIQVPTQRVQVSDTAPTIDVNPTNNAGAIVISGKELEALPDDPDELQSDLEALAGPSAGPNGGQMYIDGFTAGQLPPKSSIREIRINQNPFSSEYDKLGYGRIEIFTKPGTDKFHGQFMADGNDSAFNSPDPFAGAEPPYYSTLYNGNIGGPINKNASFFFNIDRRNINDLSVVNAIDPNTGNRLVGNLANPRQRTNLSPRVDWALSKNNTLTVRYQYWRNTEAGDLGSGQLNLLAQASSSRETENTAQISDTQVFGSKIINETRFQYNRDHTIQTPTDTNPATDVLGAFVGGGNEGGSQNDLDNNYELQNYTSVIHGNHIFKFGARFRDTRETNYSTSGFNGTFTFAPPPPGVAFNSANEQPNQLAITACATNQVFSQCNPNAAINYFDFEPYFQDDWHMRPNITLSYGLRFETQNAIHDHGDWAPRLGFAWGVRGRSSPPIVVIRGGFGIFYDRFESEQILQQERLNGVTEQEYIFTNPTCFPGLDKPLAVSTLSTCGASTFTTYAINPRLHAPYTLQGAVSVERQLTKSATLSVTYLNSRGFDQFLTINAIPPDPNAPYPGGPCYPNCAISSENLYKYVSEGNFKQNQLIVNSNIRVRSRLQLFTYYTLNYANSDTSGVSSFATNSYDISQDYGRASFDTRHRLFLGGSVGLPYLFRLSPFMVVSSGSPFNIVSPFDLNGDSIYNDRPGLVSTATCPLGAPPQGTIYCTPLGTYDATGATGRLLPINSGTGPAHFVLHLRLTKTIGIGPKIKEGQQGQGGPGGGDHHHHGPLFGGGGPMIMSSNSDRRYNLTLGLGVRNVFNNVNLANPGGTLGSHLFDVSTGLQRGPFSGSAFNRRVDLQATFSF